MRRKGWKERIKRKKERKRRASVAFIRESNTYFTMKRSEEEEERRGVGVRGGRGEEGRREGCVGRELWVGRRDRRGNGEK